MDLGLSSGTKWAACNVGASKPSDYGLYFQWGDTQGYTASQVGTGDGQKKFAKDWSGYKWNPSHDGKTFTKYTTFNTELELEDDAAHINMGGNWHMPTSMQFQELLDNTTNTWTKQDGVNGRLFTSTKNGKSIFIPAAGIALDGSTKHSGDKCSIWLPELTIPLVYSGMEFFGNSNDAYLAGGTSRYCGYSIRGVIG